MSFADPRLFGDTTVYQKKVTMSSKLEEALEIAKDSQRRLGINIGGKNVEPGQFIPKAGRYQKSRPPVSE